MKYGRSLDVMRGAADKHLNEAVLRRAAVKRDVCAAVRAELEGLGGAFDPWDGPLDYALSKAYKDAASRRRKESGAAAAVRFLEVAHDAGGERVDRRPYQLSLLEAHEALDRRIDQHDADSVWIARWQRVLTAADRAADQRQADPRAVTLGQLIGDETVLEYLREAS